MQKWADFALKEEKKKASQIGSKFLKANQELRHQQKFPFASEVENEPEEIVGVMKALQCTSFNWFKSPGPCQTNTKPGMRALGKALLAEIAQNKAYRISLVQDTPGLCFIRKELISLVRETPGLKKFKYWFIIKGVEEGSKRVEFTEDILQSKAIIQSQAQVQGGQDLLAKFYRNLAKEGICGIPLSGKEGSPKSSAFGLHPALKRSFLLDKVSFLYLVSKYALG